MIVVEGRDAPLVLGGRDLLEQRVGQEGQVGQVDATQDVAVPEVQKNEHLRSISVVFRITLVLGSLLAAFCLPVSHWQYLPTL